LVQKLKIVDMNIHEFNNQRKELNSLMVENDEFFKDFGNLDDAVYADGAIPKKYKELTGLSISVLTRCEECILYHIQGCLAANANKKEIIEAIKIGVIGGGSITYPSARHTFKILRELGVIY
jgi:AhpD family alkylhydroperoxidase